MVKNKLVSYSVPDADAWLWPVIAKDDGENENYFITILPTFVFAIAVPFMSLVFVFGMWGMYRLELLSLRKLKMVCFISGALWFALCWIFGLGSAFSEVWHSIIWHPDMHHINRFILLMVTRTIFLISMFFVICIVFNRRQVNPENVHIKVAYRQRHERMRHMRKWQKTIILKEIL